MAHTTEITIGGIVQTVREFDSTAQEIDDAVEAVSNLQAAALLRFVLRHERVRG